MGCGASTNVLQRLEYITELESEVQDLKAQRDEALRRVAITESEREKVAIQSLKNRDSAKAAKKRAVDVETEGSIQTAYLDAQYARIKANEEELVREVKSLRANNHLLKLEVDSAKLEISTQEKSLRKDIQTLEQERNAIASTLIENYELVILDLINKQRDMMSENIDFLQHISDLADGLKIKQVKLDTNADIERRNENLQAFNRVPFSDYVKEAKSFMMTDPNLKDLLDGKKSKQETLNLQEIEERRRIENEKIEKDRSERVKIYELADLAPKLQREVEQLKGDKSELEKENNDLKVRIAQLEIFASQVQQHHMNVNSDSLQSSEYQTFASFQQTETSVHSLSLGYNENSHLSDSVFELDAAEIEMKLDANFRDISNPKDRVKFEELFIQDTAKALGIPVSQIKIKGIKPGSIIVEFVILPDRESPREERRATPMDLANELEKQMEDQSSPLRQGIVTCSAVKLRSRPSSAASFNSPLEETGSRYDPRKIRGAMSEKGKLREQLRKEQRNQDQRRKQHSKEVEDALLFSPELADVERAVAEKELLRVPPVQESKASGAVAHKRQVEILDVEDEKLLDESESIMTDPLDESRSIDRSVSLSWWTSHQHHKLNDSLEVAGREFQHPNKHARVFIHTSFRDFIEERRDLARHVYPSLMHLCFERGVAFSPVDLFWQTANSDEACEFEQLHYALDEVDDCNYFLFWIGGKYGWVPPSESLHEVEKQRSWLSELRLSSFHALSMAEILFERAVMSNVQAAGGRVFFYFRDKSYGDAVDEKLRPHFIALDSDEDEKLDALRERMRQTHMQVLEDYFDPMNSVRQAHDDLKDAIVRDIPEVNDHIKIDFIRDINAHSAYSLSRRRSYVSVNDWYDEIHGHLDTRKHLTHPLLLVAPPGVGKTSLVSNYVSEFRSYLPQGLWILYHVGCHNESRNYQRICYFIMKSIQERFHLEEKIPKCTTPQEWQKELTVWINMAASKGRVVLIIDGLDQVDDEFGNAFDLQWLPKFFPAEVRTVITSSPGAVLDSLLSRGWPYYELGLFDKGRDWVSLDLETRAEIVERYVLHRKYKPMDPVTVNSMLEHHLSGNILFLLQLADELCILDQAGRSSEAADYMLLLQAQDLVSFFDYVLWRWEQYFDALHSNFLRRVLCIIWASRWGIAEQEILIIFQDISRISLNHFFSTTRSCWVWHNGMVNFSHQLLRSAVEFRYLPSKVEKCDMHRKIAGYLRTLTLGRRRLEEEAWQWMNGEAWLELISTINNFTAFHKLSDENNAPYSLDLRRFYRSVDLHLDAAHGLLQGIKNFEKTHPEPSEFLEIAQRLADFFANVGRPLEASEIYKKMVDQPKDVVESSLAMRMRITGLQVSLAKLYRARWNNGERDFALMNTARSYLERAFKSYSDLLIAAEDVYENVRAQKDLPQSEKDLAESILQETRSDFTDVLGIIGQVCVSQGDYESAESYLYQGLKACESFNHSNHPSVAMITQGLAELYFQKRTYDKAEAMARRTVMIRHICYGWNHPQYAHALATLASVLSAIGNEYESEQLMKRQAKILLLYPDAATHQEPVPDRTYGNELEGTTPWQGPGGSGKGRGILKSSSTYAIAKEAESSASLNALEAED